MKNNRVIIDTNLWISFLISKNFTELDFLISTGKVTLLFSAELLEEFLEVTKRPKFSRYFNKKDLESLLKNLENIAEIIVITTQTDVCRDIKDNFLLNLCIDGNADFLITGDEDLLVLKKIGSTHIMRWSEFLIEIHKKT
jgi:putative PIN family toxin of toxin-antitoxin system